MNSRLLRQWSCRPAIRHVPDLFFLDRSSIDNLKIAVDSRQIYENTVSWVTSRFSSASDDLLFLADDFGQLVLIDISQFDKPLPPNAICSHLIRAKVQAHSAAVIDIVNVPGRPNEILTFSGDTQVKIWDVSTGQMQLFFGHQRTVKCGSFIPDSPFVFVTGSKAGDVQVWDRRVVEVQKKNLKGRRSVLSCDKAFKESNNQPSCPAVTGIACTSEVTVVAGSANLNCGLKVFDLRKPNLNKPSAWISTYKMPNMHKAREGVGITSLCLDRHSASLFASARSHRIYEFAANSSIQDPVRILHGVHIVDYCSQITCSPVSDHLISGSDSKSAYIWDLQKIPRDPEGLTVDVDSVETQPIFALHGHTSKVPSVACSQNATYIASIDVESNVRIWQHDPEEWLVSEDEKLKKPICKDPEFIGYERVQLCGDSKNGSDFDG